VEISTPSAISTAVEGLRKAQNQVEQAAQNIAEGPVRAEDVVSLSLAATSFKANAAVIRTENETLQTLLDVTV
jgi:flagellar hook protein FlgE